MANFKFSILFFVILIFSREVVSFNDDENSVLYNRCVSLIDIYSKNDYVSYINEFHPKIVSIIGTNYFKNDLAKKSLKMHEEYGNSIKSIKLESVETFTPHEQDIKQLNVSNGKEFIVYIDGEKSSAITSCKYIKSDETWFLRKGLML